MNVSVLPSWDLPNLLQLHPHLPLAPIAEQIYSWTRSLLLISGCIDWMPAPPVDGSCPLVPSNGIHQSNPLSGVPLSHLVRWRDVLGISLANQIVMPDGFCDDPTSDVITVPVSSCETPAWVRIFCEMHNVWVHLKISTMIMIMMIWFSLQRRQSRHHGRGRSSPSWLLPLRPDHIGTFLDFLWFS